MYYKRSLLIIFHSNEIESTMSESAQASSSSTHTQTKLPANVVRVDLEDRKKKNAAWIGAYKKTHGIKKQTTLPSATTAHNEWAILQGWSMIDATTWRSLCEKAKYATDDTEGVGILCLLAETIDIANHCDTHPVGLLHNARTAMDRKVWDLDSVDFLKANLLAEVDETAEREGFIPDDDDGPTPPNTPPSQKRKVSAPSAPSRKKAMYEASQPFDIDDDVVRD